jgi:hypothetical protein
VILVAVLSGKCSKELIALCTQKQQILVQEPLRELLSCQQRLDVCKRDEQNAGADIKQQEEIHWIQSRIGFVQNRIDEQTEISRKFINKLETFA